MGGMAFGLLMLFALHGLIPSISILALLLIPDLPCLLHGDLWVCADPVVLLFAVLGGVEAVSPQPVLTARRIDLKQESAAIRDSSPCCAWFYYLGLGIV